MISECFDTKACSTFSNSGFPFYIPHHSAKRYQNLNGCKTILNSTILLLWWHRVIVLYVEPGYYSTVWLFADILLQPLLYPLRHGNEYQLRGNSSALRLERYAWRRIRYLVVYLCTDLMKEGRWITCLHSCREYCIFIVSLYFSSQTYVFIVE